MKPAILHEYKGELLTVNEIAKRSNVNSQLIRHRLDIGWSVERAVNTPKLTASQASRISRKKSPWSKGPMIGAKR